MDTFLIEKAKRLKSEGYDFGKIRTYLSNAGYDDQSITSAFRLLDEEEIHQLYQKQQIARLKTGVFVSLVPSVLGLVYVSYQYIIFQSVEVISLLPLGFFFVAYRNYRRIKATKFTTHEILKEARNSNHWRNNW